MVPRWTISQVCYVLFCLLVGCFSESTGQKSAVVDASIYLLYLPSRMNTSVVEDFSTAMEVFLESSFKSDPMLVNDIQVMFLSQSVNGRVAIGDNSTYFVVQANMQVLIKYQEKKTSDQWKQSQMDALTRRYLTKNWMALQSMLRLLDPTFFEYLNYIELKSKTLDSVQPPSAENGTQGGAIKHGMSKNISIIIMAVGFGIVVASITILIPVCLTRRSCKQGSARGTIVSSFMSDGSHRQSHEVSRQPSSQPETSAISQKQIPLEHNLSWTPSEIFVTDDGGSTSHIQRIFSEDKLCYVDDPSHHNISIRNLKDVMQSAENVLRESMSGIMRKIPSDGEDLEQGRGEANMTDDDQVKTERNSTREKKESRRVMSAKKSGRKATVGDPSKRQLVRDNANSSSHQSRAKKENSPTTQKIKAVVPSEPVTNEKSVQQKPTIDCSKRSNSRVAGPSVSTVEAFSSASPFPVICHTNDHDGCSVSTMSGGVSMFSFSDQEKASSANEVASLEDLFARSNCKDLKQTHPQNGDDGDDDEEDEEYSSHTSLTYRIGSDADDFGSMAESLPSCLLEEPQELEV